MKNLICIIPARKGSKGIKNKNIRKLNKKPLIEYTIDFVKFFKFDTYLSTDSHKIHSMYSNNLKSNGLRPKKLSSDTSVTYDVVKYELNKAEKNTKKSYKYILLLQPTYPFRKKTHLIKALRVIKNNNYDTVVSVYPVGANHPKRMKKFKGKYLINYDNSKKENMLPRQSLDKAYIRSGSIYLIKRKSFEKYKSLVGRKVFGLIDDTDGINIDSFDDLKKARSYIKNFKK
tara:strand:+ start:456 stop:1145 length:690 start_codon:yes stop_codon:yes gene_type:complete